MTESDGTEDRCNLGFDSTIAKRRFAWNVHTTSSNPEEVVRAFEILTAPMPDESVKRCHEMAKDGIFVPPHPDHVWDEMPFLQKIFGDKEA